MPSGLIATELMTRTVLKRSCQYNVLVPEVLPATSERRDELLERAYQYVVANGLSGMSLRPLAAAIGSSPRVLLFLFGSKDELIRALLARARADEVARLARVRSVDGGGLPAVAAEVWEWLCEDEHRGLLNLWTESYARSLVEPEGPWGGFGRQTVDDWLALLGEADGDAGETERTLVLALLRGALMDLLATGDRQRTSRAVIEGLNGLRLGLGCPRETSC